MKHNIKTLYKRIHCYAMLSISSHPHSFLVITNDFIILCVHICFDKTQKQSSIVAVWCSVRSSLGNKCLSNIWCSLIHQENRQAISTCNSCPLAHRIHEEYYHLLNTKMRFRQIL